jgi:hypothetical protein
MGPIRGATISARARPQSSRSSWRRARFHPFTPPLTPDTNRTRFRHPLSPWKRGFPEGNSIFAPFPMSVFLFLQEQEHERTLSFCLKCFVFGVFGASQGKEIQKKSKAGPARRAGSEISKSLHNCRRPKQNLLFGRAVAQLGKECTPIWPAAAKHPAGAGVRIKSQPLVIPLNSGENFPLTACPAVMRLKICVALGALRSKAHPPEHSSLRPTATISGPGWATTWPWRGGVAPGS